MRRLLVVVLLGALFALAAPLAQAADVEDLQISPSEPVAEGDYQGGPLILANPDVNTNSPSACRVAEYCDTIDLDITVPEGYDKDFNVRITVSWATDGGDLDVTFYNSQERLVARAWTGNNPEVIRLPFMEAGRYYITVLQFDTPLVIYNVKVELIVREIVQPRQRSSSTTAFSSPSGSSGFGSAGRDSSLGEPSFGGGFGVVPVGESPPSLEPIALDLPDDESGRVGFAPLDDDVEIGSSIRFDGGRVAVGLLLLAVIALLSYFLFFVPRKDPIRRLEPAA